MAVIVRIETTKLDVLEWGEQFNPEQEEYHDSIIESFEFELERYLTYTINGYVQLNIKFDYNPITNTFILSECNSPLVHHVEDALRTELKNYI